MFGKKQQERIAGLEKQVNDLQSENMRLQSCQAEMEDAIETFAEKEADWKKKVERAESDVKAERESTKAKLVMSEKSVARKVNAQLAAIGVNTFAPEIFEGPEAKAGGENLLNQLNNLPPEKRTEFYEKHKKEILMLGLTTQGPV